MKKGTCLENGVQKKRFDGNGSFNAIGFRVKFKMFFLVTANEFCSKVVFCNILFKIFFKSKISRNNSTAVRSCNLKKSIEMLWVTFYLFAFFKESSITFISYFP